MLDLAVDEHRHDDAAAVLGQAASILRLGRHARDQADDLLGQQRSIRDGHHIRPLRIFGRHQQQALAVDVAKRRPAHGEDFEAVAAAKQGRPGGGAHELQVLKRYPRIAHTQDVGQSLTIAFNGALVIPGRGKIALPVATAALPCPASFAQQELVGPGHQVGGDVALQHQGCRARQCLRSLSTCGSQTPQGDEDDRVHVLSSLAPKPAAEQREAAG